MVRLLMMKGVTRNVFSNHTYVESVSGKRGASSLIPRVVIKG